MAAANRAIAAYSRVTSTMDSRFRGNDEGKRVFLLSRTEVGYIKPRQNENRV
jgi:hypothetical protein